MSIFDATLFPLMIAAGRELYDLPGLLAVTAPKRAGRLRSKDLLILYARLSGPDGKPAAFTNSQHKEILTRLADTYFTSQGSLTAGLKVTANRLNEFLFNRNIKAGADNQTTGSLTLAVIHGSTLMVAHSGPTNSFVLAKGQVQHFDDSVGMRSLGLGRQPTIRFYQTTVEPDNVLVFCLDAPKTWSKSLVGSPQRNMDAIRRLFISEGKSDLQVATIRLTAGKGLVNFWRPAGDQPTASRRRTQTQPDGTVSTGAVEKEQAVAELTTQVKPSDLPEISDHRIEGAQPPISETSLPVVEDIDQLSDHSVQPDTADEVVAENTEIKTGIEQEAISNISAEVVDKTKPDKAQQEIAIFLGSSSSDPNRTEILSARPSHDSQPTGQMTSSSALNSQAGIGNQTVTSSVRSERKPLGRIERQQQSQRAALEQARPPVREKKPQPVKPTGPPLSERLRLWLAPIWNQSRRNIDRVRGAAGSTAARVMPGRASQPDKTPEPLINLSPARMIVIAMLVPVLVVAAATTVYIRAGRTEQFDVLFSQAQQYASQADQQNDPELLKQTWMTTYNLVLEAEKYGTTDESAALKTRALDALDNLQGIIRLNFEPATTSPYSTETNITRMVANLNQVYMLDATSGSILSMTRVTTGGFEPNYSFSCVPGKAGSLIVGPMIDLAEIPINNEMDADIMGIDASGNLVYCAAGKSGIDSQALEPPDNGWGKITAITTYGETLYILDPPANMVYRYDGIRGIFENKPHLYFDDAIPYLADVIDIAIDQEFLYLLHDSGSMTVCSTGGVIYGTTRCTENSPYGDPRAGYEPAPTAFAGTRFTHVQTTQPPDPSLFTLDAANQAIYHLSQRRLNLQYEYRGKLDGEYLFPDRAPTAFAITPNRRALIAFGNQVFFAALP